MNDVKVRCGACAAAIALAFATGLCGGAARADTGEAAAALPAIRYDLIKDIDAAPGAKGSDPSDFVAWNGRVYFSAKTLASGVELFRTDGTVAGTQLAYDFMPGPASSGARPLGAVNGRLVVEADNGLFGRQLWALADGLPPVRLTSLATSTVTFRPYADLGGRLLLSATWGGALWSTDGTPEGTAALDSTSPLYGWQLASTPCVLGSLAMFLVRDLSTGYWLASTDGGANGLQLAAQVPVTYGVGNVSSLAISGQCQFLIGSYAGDGWSLWTTNGTAATTGRVAMSATGYPRGLYALGGALHIAQTTPTRLQLLRNNPGTVEFPVSLDLPTASGVRGPYAAGDRIVFGLRQAYSDPDAMWTSDGTTAGTRLLYPTLPSQSIPTLYEEPVIVGGALLLQGRETGIRVDLATGAASPAPSSLLFDFDTSVAFGASRVGAGTGADGVEPWMSDGTGQGTRKIADLWQETGDGLGAPDATSIASTQASAYGDVLYFTRPVGGVSSDRRELWRTDGTTSETRKLPAALLDYNSVSTPQARADGVAFLDRDTQLYRSRLVHADTQLGTLAALSPYTVIEGPLEAGDGLLFLADSPTGGDLYATTGTGDANPLWPGFGRTPTALRLVGRIGGITIFYGGSVGDIWRSDGTSPGTFRLLEVANYPPSYRQWGSAVLNGKLVFDSCTGLDACAVYATDGTIAGTAPLRQLDAAFTYSNGESYAAVGDRVVFTVGRRQLWASDGTAAGTDILLLLTATASDIAVAGGLAHVALDCGEQSCANRYVVTDGTKSGTRFVETPSGVVPKADLMTSLGGATLFSCRVRNLGDELCTADADGGNLRLLADFHLGPDGSSPRLIGTTAQGAVVKIDDGVHGYEPWFIRQPGDHIFASGFETAALRKGGSTP